MNKVEMEIDNMPDELSIIPHWQMRERGGWREEEGERRKIYSQLLVTGNIREEEMPFHLPGAFLSGSDYYLDRFFLRNRLLICYYFITDRCRL